MGEGQRWKKSSEPISSWRSCEDRSTYREIRPVRWESVEAGRFESTERLPARTYGEFQSARGGVEKESETGLLARASSIHTIETRANKELARGVLSTVERQERSPFPSERGGEGIETKKGRQSGGKGRAKNGGDLLNQASLLAAESFLRGALTNGRLIPRECSARQASNDCQLTTLSPRTRLKVHSNNCRWCHYYLSLWSILSSAFSFSRTNCRT